MTINRHTRWVKITAMAVVCLFLLNGTSSAVPSRISFSKNTLAASLIFGDIDGTDIQNIGKIELALQANLMSRVKSSIDIDLLREEVLLKKRNLLFIPQDINFIFSGEGLRKLSDEYAVLECTGKGENNEVRKYHAVFSLARDDGYGFSSEVYTDEEWNRLEELLRSSNVAIFPKRSEIKPKDAEAVRESYLREQSRVQKRGIDLQEPFDVVVNDTERMGTVDVVFADADGVDIIYPPASKVKILPDEVVEAKRVLAQLGVLNITLTGEQRDRCIKKCGGLARMARQGVGKLLYHFLVRSGASGEVLNSDGSTHPIQGYPSAELSLKNDDSIPGRIREILIEEAKQVLREHGEDPGRVDAQMELKPITCAKDGVTLYVDSDDVLLRGLRHEIAKRVKVKVEKMKQAGEVIPTAEIVFSSGAVDIMTMPKGHAAIKMIKLKNMKRVVLIADSVGTKDNPGNDRSMLAITQDDLGKAGIDWEVDLIKFYVGSEPDAEMPEGVYVMPENRKKIAPSLGIYEAIACAKEITNNTALAGKVGVEISRPLLEENYTLITCDDVYEDEKDYERDVLEYGSIFNIAKIKPGKPKTIITRILKKIASQGIIPGNVMVQLPKVFSESEYKSELERLVKNAPGIRFMIIDTQGLKGEDNRANYRRNIYAIMLLARKIDEDIPKDSGLYRLLKFFMNSCLGEGKDDVITSYLEALVSGDISLIVKTVLSYKPIEKYDNPSYDRVAAVLVSA
jgi:hypothetical protein